jgi:Holliday junction DNA helicase RuvA
VIAFVRGRLTAKSADRVVVETAGGVGYELTVPLGVMERLPPPGAGTEITLATELVVREDGWSLYGFLDESERRFFQRLTSVSGVGPKIAVAVMSALGVERGARAVREKNIALLSSVTGIGKKTAERLALELGDKVDEFVDGGGGGATAAAPPLARGAEAALKALERLGYSTAEADRAVREALSGNGGWGGGLERETEALVRRALQVLTTT